MLGQQTVFLYPHREPLFSSLCVHIQWRQNERQHGVAVISCICCNKRRGCLWMPREQHHLSFYFVRDGV